MSLAAPADATLPEAAGAAAAGALPGGTPAVPAAPARPSWLDQWGAALRHPHFRVLFFSLLPGTLGMMMASLAFGYLAYRLSGSATTLAIVNAGWGLPMVLVSPFAGVAADRFNRRTIIITTQSVIGLTAVAAALLVATGVIQVWHLFVVAVVQGVSFSFNMPARQALIAEVAGRDDLANALALQNAGLSFNRVAGPAIGGALLSLPAIGATGVFAAMASLYALVLFLLRRLPRTVGRAPTTPPLRTRGPAQFVEGFRYVISRPPLRRLLLLAFLPLLFGMPYQALMPAVAARVFHVEAAGLGALLTANGVGALAGSLVLARLGTPNRLSGLQLAAGLLFGAALVAFALTGAFLPALACIAVVGGASAVYSAVNNTLLMSETPPEFHGRVMGVYFMTFAAMPLSSLPAAWTAERLGLPTTLVLSGLLSATVVALGAARWRRRAHGGQDAERS